MERETKRLPRWRQRNGRVRRVAAEEPCQLSFLASTLLPLTAGSGCMPSWAATLGNSRWNQPSLALAQLMKQLSATRREGLAGWAATPTHDCIPAPRSAHLGW